MGQQQRPFVADPNEWEVIPADDLEVVPDEAPAKTPTWGDRLGLNKPTSSPMVGFLRGSGNAVADMAQGFVGSLANQAFEIGQTEQRGVDQQADPKAVQPPVPKEGVVEIPRSPAGLIGTLLPVKMPAGLTGVKMAEEALPSAARAGRGFQEVMGAAKNIPVDVSEVGDVALRINQLAERGGSMPMAVRKILNRMTDPKKPAMVYEEMRDFGSNISRLSADEMQRMTPVLRREVARLSAAINKANAEAAKIAGKGAEYKSAMREYARAMQMKDALDVMIKRAKQAALPAAGLGGAAYWLGRD
jgi:hypothetical protein